MTTPEPQRRFRILVVAPLPPARGGIAQCSALLIAQLRSAHAVTVWAIDPLYPAWLFPGNATADPQQTHNPVAIDARVHGWSPVSWWRSWRAVPTGGYDIVLWQWWTPYWIPFLCVVLWQARRRRIPTIALNHQLVEPDAAPWQRHLAAWMLQRAGAVINFGTATHCHPRETTVPLPLHHNLMPALTPDERQCLREETRSTLGIPSTALVVLCYGFVRPYKGTDIIVAAVHNTPATVHLVIAGEWWRNTAALRAACTHPAVRTRVHILDTYIPAAATPGLFVASDVVALPYRSGTVSGVATVAAAAGVPLLISATGALGGLATACDVVHPNTPAAWAAALTQRAAAPPSPVAPVPSQPGWLALQRAIEGYAAALRGQQ